jgi:hypothetical protein
MAVPAIFNYDITPGRVNNFMAKLAAAADAKFVSKVMPKGIHLFGRTARPDCESSNAECRELYAAKQDSPGTLEMMRPCRCKLVISGRPSGR